MNLYQAFKMAFKSISCKKTRSFLTMLGIIIGVASVVIMVSVVQGQNKKNMEYFEKMGDNKITVYAQDGNGGYFMYEMACSEEDAAKLVPGTKIKVTGYKAEWQGEIEIMDATFEIVEGNYVAEAKDLTEYLGKDELVNYQNMKALFKGMTVVSVAYKNDQRGDDVYLTVEKDGATYDFCVEMYLTGPDTDVYKAVEALTAGDVVDIECFLYWYVGANPHIIGVNTAK